MKSYKLQESSNTPSRKPFWMPWGPLGCLWRTIVFIVALILFILFLQIFKTCNSTTPTSKGEYTPIPPARPYHDTIPWTKPVDNPVEELPIENENIIPPIEDEDIIANPEEPISKIVSGRLNVMLDSEANDDTFNKFATEFKSLYPSNDYEIVYYNTLTKMLQISIPESDRIRIKNNLNQEIPDISFKIFDESLFGSNKKTSDPFLTNQAIGSWYFDAIQAYDAWDITMGNDSVIVAIVDSYFDLNHEELKQKNVGTYSIENKTTDVAPPQNLDKNSAEYMHGTFVASIAAGNANNQNGACGIAPNCKLMPISLGCKMSTFKIIEGILYAIYQGADVVNLSMGIDIKQNEVPSVDEQITISNEVFKIEEDVFNYINNLANKRNCMLVWAAGNESILTGIDYCKRSDSILIVSAIDENLRATEFTNFGYINQNNKTLFSTVSAPGTNIKSAIPNNQYKVSNGTSFSSPIVAGAVALLKSVNNKLSNTEIINILKITGKPISSRNYIGNLIQIKDALDYAQMGILNYDDVINDNNLIIGLWKSTEKLNAYNNKRPTGEIIEIYMEFETTTHGTLYLKETPSGYLYKAPLLVSFKDDNIIIEQIANAVCVNSETNYLKYLFDCKPDNRRLLKCKASTLNKESIFEFNLIKVNKIN